MIDKLLQQYTGSPNVSGMVQEETGKAGQVGKGLEGQKQKFGLRMKRGGFIAKGCGKVMNNRRKITKVY